MPQTGNAVILTLTPPPKQVDFTGVTGANIPNRGCFFDYKSTDTRLAGKSLILGTTAYAQYSGIHTSNPQCEATFIPYMAVCDNADPTQCPNFTSRTKTSTTAVPNAGCPIGYVVGGFSINTDNSATVYCRPVVNFSAPSAAY